MADRNRITDGLVGPRRFLDAATTSSYRFGAFAARHLPAVVAAGMVTPAGFGANLASPERRAMIERHLRRADPTLRGLRLRRAVQEAFQVAAALFQQPLPDDLLRRLEDPHFHDPAPARADFAAFE